MLLCVWVCFWKSKEMDTKKEHETDFIFESASRKQTQKGTTEKWLYKFKSTKSTGLGSNKKNGMEEPIGWAGPTQKLLQK